MGSLLQWLREPAVQGVDVDSDDRLRQHERVLARKPILQDVFREFHAWFKDADASYLSGDGLRIEIGAGIAPLRGSLPGVLSTDIVFAASLDMCLDAQAFPLKDGSVRAVFAQNAFHHLPNPRLFFSELQRILVPGGGAVLIEPHFGPLASVIYPRLFKSEGFDKAFPEWEVPAAGPMNGANQALSYIVFVRDLQTFAAEFPLLEVVHRGALTNGPRYVLSGGLNFRQLVPQVFSPVVKAIEGLLWPLREVIGLHQMIVIRRRSI